VIKEHIMTKVIVFDIDGTVANITHRRHWVATKPKNWAAFNAGMAQDTVYTDIKYIYDTFAAEGNTIIFCSGRGEENRAVTEAWLRANGFAWSALYMRSARDHRQDSIVKVELLHDIQRDWAWPFIWFDDRDSVVQSIREQGVRVCQVAPGNF
jgi:predicted secreted acid phosphatase